MRSPDKGEVVWQPGETGNKEESHMKLDRAVVRQAILAQVERDALCCSFGVDELTNAIIALQEPAPDREAAMASVAHFQKKVAQ